MDTSGRDRLAGFTLIEILVTLSIVAILAAVAYPSYLAQIRKVRRADAQAVLMQNAQFLQRIHTQTGCYDPGSGADDMDCNDGTRDDVPLPYDETPIDGTAKYYDIVYSDSPPGGAQYQLVANPKPGTSQAGTGSLTLDDLGIKTWNGEDGW